MSDKKILSINEMLNGHLKGNYKAINWNQVDDKVDSATWSKLTEQFWLDTRIPVSNDLKDWRELDDDAKYLVGHVFGGLTMLDTLQSQDGMASLRKDSSTQHEIAVLNNIAFMECLTKGHKLLTPDGFKDVSEIKKDDLVLQYNPDDKSSNFAKVKTVSSHMPDKILHFKNRKFDLRVSPGHRMFYEQKENSNNKTSGKWIGKTITADKYDSLAKYANRRNVLTPHSFKSDNTDKSLSPLEQFLIAFQADGCIGSKDRINNDKISRMTLKFGFKRKRKIDRFRDIISKLDQSKFDITEGNGHGTKIGYKLFYISIDKNFMNELNITPEKKFELMFSLNKFTQEKANLFLEELKYWDGHIFDDKDGDGFVYTTSTKFNRNFVEAVCSLSGRAFIRYTKYDIRNNTDNHENYQVRIWTSERNYYAGFQGETKIIEEEPEMVYGIEVPSTYLFVLTPNGKPVITGNCVHAKSYSTIFSTLNTPNEIKEIFDWSDSEEFLQNKAKRIYNLYHNDSNPLKKKIASVFLESFLFYSGFFTPLWYLGNNKMTNVAEIIKQILKDESCHGTYIGYKFQIQFNQLPKNEQDKLKDWMYNFLYELYENEVQYTHMLYDKIGWTENVLTFVRYNANKALMNLGFSPLFPDTADDVNPIIMNGISTASVNHDFFSEVGNSYRMGSVEAMNDDDYDKYSN